MDNTYKASKAVSIQDSITINQQLQDASVSKTLSEHSSDNQISEKESIHSQEEMASNYAVNKKEARYNKVNPMAYREKTFSSAHPSP